MPSYMSYHAAILRNETTHLVENDGTVEGGGDRIIDSYSGVGRNFSTVHEAGRNPVNYSFQISSENRALIEEALAIINGAPRDAEFYPHEDDRCVYATVGSAKRPKVMPYRNGDLLYYYADVDITARNGMVYAAEQGEELQNVALPHIGATLTNRGNYENTLDYFYISGGYDSTSGLTRDVKLIVGEYEINLCSCLMWKDSFVMDRFGQVTHKKETDFPMVYGSLQDALGGPTFFDLYSPLHYAKYETILTVGNTNLVYADSIGGAPANAYTVAYVDPGGTTATLAITITGSAISVSLGRAANAINTTATMVLSLWNLTHPLGLVAAPAAGSDGSGLLTAMTAKYLTGGADRSIHEGEVTYQALRMPNESHMMFPFYGPLPISGSPYVEVTISALNGFPKASAAFAGDLSDITELDYILKVGVNKFYVPNCAGEDFVAIGIVCDETSSCTISDISIQVPRYMSPDDLPILPIDEDFTYQIMDGEFSNHKLENLHIVYRDAF